MSFIHIKDLKEIENMPGYKARFIHAEQMTIAYYTVKAGAPFPLHQHPHEQISNMLEGKMEFTLDGKTEIIEAGKVVVIPANTPHSGIALTDCKILDVFSPIREDYRKLSEM